MTTPSFPSGDLTLGESGLALEISKASSSYNKLQRDPGGAPKWANYTTGTDKASVCGI